MSHKSVVPFHCDISTLFNVSWAFFAQNLFLQCSKPYILRIVRKKTTQHCYSFLTVKTLPNEVFMGIFGKLLTCRF